MTKQTIDAIKNLPAGERTFYPSPDNVNKFREMPFTTTDLHDLVDRLEAYEQMMGEAREGSEIWFGDDSIELCNDGLWRSSMATVQYGAGPVQFIQEGRSPLEAFAALKENDHAKK